MSLMNRPARRVRSNRPTRATAPGARRIETAARRLFANRGYAGTSMAEIAAAAGVSKATVFHHYRSKRALYEALVGDAMAGFREQIVPLLDAGADLQGSLREFAAAHVDRLTRMQGTMRLIAREMMSGTPASGELLSGSGLTQNFALLVDVLRRGQASGTVRADVDPGLAVFLLLCANWFLFQTGSLTRRNPDLAVTASTETYAAELARLLYHGLAPPAGPHPQDTP
jgi:TetR/AcrR family transcriptional regulator